MRVKFNIRIKLWIGFGFLLGALLINGLVTYFVSMEATRLHTELDKVLMPSVNYLLEVKSDLSKSQDLISSWLSNTDEDIPQKSSLSAIHNESYPFNSKELKKVSLKWSTKDKVKLDSILVRVNKVLEAQHSVMIKYDEAESYYTTFAKKELPDLKRSFENGVKYDETNLLLSELEDNILKKKTQYTKVVSNIQAVNSKMRTLIILFVGLFLLVGALLAMFITNSIVRPIKVLNGLLTTMGRGVLPKVTLEKRKDELGEMGNALSDLIKGLKSIVSFSKSIGSGDFDTEFRSLSKDDALGNNLLIMRDNLKNVSEEDRKRNWTTGGLAKFSELLREESDNVDSLTEKLITELVSYLNANQGGVFVLDNTDEVPFMNLKSCYAWDRRKFIDQKIYSGDGLIGQSWLEQDVLYITDVPNDYIKITSGLGKALPKSLLIVPMISNEEVYGVIEVASFYEFEEHEIEFIKQLAESTAATISSANVNQRTKELLKQTQVNSDQLKKHEEDLVSNQQEMKKNQDVLGNEIEALRNKVIELSNSKEILKDENETMQMLILKYKKELDSKPE